MVNVSDINCWLQPGDLYRVSRWNYHIPVTGQDLERVLEQLQFQGLTCYLEKCFIKKTKLRVSWSYHYQRICNRLRKYVSKFEETIAPNIDTMTTTKAFKWTATATPSSGPRISCYFDPMKISPTSYRPTPARLGWMSASTRRLQLRNDMSFLTPASSFLRQSSTTIATNRSALWMFGPSSEFSPILKIRVYAFAQTTEACSGWVRWWTQNKNSPGGHYSYRSTLHHWTLSKPTIPAPRRSIQRLRGCCNSRPGNQLTQKDCFPLFYVWSLMNWPFNK